ncbi:MAG: trehalose-phosphatase [Solirubrobacterales bacterium]|nr:MAG: trehalose-phosphatase [Solirubrobacterales bacterium]
MSTSVAMVDALAPVHEDPAHSAILLDVDGTLAPIVRHTQDALVDEATRALLIDVSRRYGLVACVSGRRASDARRIVSIGSIAYLGSHGSELLAPGSVVPKLDRELEPWTRRMQQFLRETDSTELQHLRVRIEDKGVIAGYHWRGAPNEDAAHAGVVEVAARAEAAGLRTHWGRKVLEVRPPVSIDKGVGITKLLRSRDIDVALYAGDDETDLDAFRALNELTESGRLRAAVRVGVRSDEGPEEIVSSADVVVDGTANVRSLLEALLTN